MDRFSNTHQGTYKLPQKMFRPVSLPLKMSTAWSTQINSSKEIEIFKYKIFTVK